MYRAGTMSHTCTEIDYLGEFYSNSSADKEFACKSGDPGSIPGLGRSSEDGIAKFRIKLKKVAKTTRPFRYDLNQIPYDYTVEVRNRLKGLDLLL